MRSAAFVLGVCLFIRHASSLIQAPLAPSRPQTIALRQELHNMDDAIYTGTLTLGGQKIQAIIDTGSFELVVLSKECPHCGDHRESLFDSQKSTSFVKGNETMNNSYGSGTAYSESAYDDILVEGLRGNDQFFWKVYDADMALNDVFREVSFAAICGVGPSKSVETFAEEELESFRKQAQWYIGGPMDSFIHETLQSLKKALETAQKSKTILDTLEIHDMSVCLGRSSGSLGYFTWNDNAAEKSPNLFLEIPVIGDIYWSLELSDVRLDQSVASSTMLGCDSKRCSAVLDTGTTLIQAPSGVAYAIDDLVQNWVLSGGDCDDLSMLPNLEFSLGGNLFTLPPEAYVAHYTGSDSSFERARILLPHLYKRHLAHREGETKPELYSYCASAISPMDADTQFGPMWIFGVSFFREYYTSFHLSPEGDNLKGSSISMSRANADCRPGQHPTSSLPHFMAAPRVGRQKAQLKLDVSKIRSSALADRVRRMATPSIQAPMRLLRSLPEMKIPVVRI